MRVRRVRGFGDRAKVGPREIRVRAAELGHRGPRLRHGGPEESQIALEIRALRRGPRRRAGDAEPRAKERQRGG